MIEEDRFLSSDYFGQAEVVPQEQAIAVVLARHGETRENRWKILQGEELDSKLDIKGILQAVDLAETIKSTNIKRIITSKLFRSKITGEVVDSVWKLDGIDVPVVAYSGLNERSYGELSGKTMEEVNEITAIAGVPLSEYHPQKGESPDVFKKRVIECFKEILSTRPDNNSFLVICHGGVLKVISEYITGIPSDNPNDPGYDLGNASAIVHKITTDKIGPKGDIIK